MRTVSAVLLVVAAPLLAADTPLPSAAGMKWHYAMTQEFGQGVHPSDKSIETDSQGKVHLPIDVYLSGKQRIGDTDTFKYDMYRQGAISLTEFLIVNDKGVTAVARSAEGSEPLLCSPPQKILSFPVNVGDKWTYKGRVADTGTEQAFEIVAKENVRVPAGQFDAFHLKLTQVSPSPPKIVEDRWFVPEVGYVKIVTTMTLPNDNLIQRIALELMEAPKLAAAPASSPTLASSSPKKLLHAALAKELLGEPMTTFPPDLPKIFLRWQGDALKSGDKIRCIWFAQDVGDVAPPNYKLDETSMRAESATAAGTFTLSKPNKGWPAGKYRVELYAGEQLAETLLFTIAK